MVKGYTSELSLKNKAARALWGIIYILFFRITPRPMHGWRCFVLRCFGSKIYKGVKIYSSARIWAPWNLTIKEGAIVGDRVDCYSVSTISIGAYAIISQDSCLCTATHNHKSEAFTMIAKPITIGDEAWVASRAFVGPGVNIGNHAIVSACAVTFKNVEDNQTVTGNPARDINSVKNELCKIN